MQRQVRVRWSDWLEGVSNFLAYLPLKLFRMACSALSKGVPNHTKKTGIMVMTAITPTRSVNIDSDCMGSPESIPRSYLEDECRG